MQYVKLFHRQREVPSADPIAAKAWEHEYIAVTNDGWASVIAHGPNAAFVFNRALRYEEDCSERDRFVYAAGESLDVRLHNPTGSGSL